LPNKIDNMSQSNSTIQGHGNISGTYAGYGGGTPAEKTTTKTQNGSTQPQKKGEIAELQR